MLASILFICVILTLLHLINHFLTRKWFLFTVIVISIIASIIMGLYAHLIWYKILIWMLVITTIMGGTFTMAAYGGEWISDIIKESLKNNKDKK